MSDIAVTWAKAQRCPSPRAKATLVHLAAYCDAEGEGWAAVGILALEMEVDDRTVQRGLSALRKAGLIAETGEQKTWQGRKVPIYRLALDVGPANTRQRLQMDRAGPSAEGSTGDTTVTPRVTPVSPHGCQPCHPTGDTTVTQIGKLKTSTEAERFANAHLSEGARAGDAVAGQGEDADVGAEPGSGPSEAFDAAFEAWIALPGGAGPTHRAVAWEVWGEQVEAAGGEARLLACVMAFVVDPSVKRRTHGPGGMQNWLRKQGWASYGGRVDAAMAAKAAVPGARFIGPAEIREAVVEALGEAMAGRTIDPAGWDGEARAVLCRTGWAFDQLKGLRPKGAEWNLVDPRMGR